MPIPKPEGGESQEDFIQRCMGNPTMNSEYPDNSQRFAVCNSQYEEAKNEEKVIEALKDFNTKIKS